MYIFLLVFSFIFIFFTTFLFHEKKEGVFTVFRLAFVESNLAGSFLVVVITEGLSFFDSLTAKNVRLSWGLVLIISVGVLAYKAKKNNDWSFLNLKFKRLFFNKKSIILLSLSILFILIILGALFLVALTITNNWDSYTYHLPRIEHWIQDKNIDFYPTNNVRQLYLAPFAEYFILNLRLLSGSTLFNNFVQFFAMLNSLLLVSLIAKLFKLDFRGQLATIIIALTIPMGLLQATTTQTDYVVSFFIVAFVFFGLSIIKKGNKFYIGDAILLSLSFALGILAKSTFYVIAFPFCVFLGIYVLRSLLWKSLYFLALVIFLFVFINGPFLNRNYKQFGSVLGPKRTDSYYLANLNDTFGFRETLSNLSKNIGLHLALPNDSYNVKVTNAIVSLHDLIGYPLNNSSTTWIGTAYATNFKLNHDTVGNFLHLILFLFAIIITFFNLKFINKTIILYILTLVSSFAFFAFLLKWQPWQTRLDLPIFVLMSPVIVYAFSVAKRKYLLVTICASSLLVAIGIVFIFDPNKPIFGDISIFKRNNSYYIFNYDIAKEIEEKLEKYKIKNIGLVLGSDSWEWAYWIASPTRKFEYVYFHKDFIKTQNFNSSFKYKALIIDNLYLNSLKSDLRISEFIENKNNVVEILNIKEKETLVIYKDKQDKIITYE